MVPTEDELLVLFHVLIAWHVEGIDDTEDGLGLLVESSLKAILKIKIYCCRVEL